MLKGYSLRNRIFLGFFFVCVLTIVATFLAIFPILRSNIEVQSSTEKQNKAEALMASLDYAVSHKQVSTNDLQDILSNKIYEIADVNKHDVIIYNLKGEYLISNKDISLVEQTQIPNELVDRVLKSGGRVDVQDIDKRIGASMVSSYMILKNNILEPIAIVYFPYYHNSSMYMDVLYQILINIGVGYAIIILLGGLFSWFISKTLTNTLTEFSEKMSNFNVLEPHLNPIKYYENDELNSLVKAYNRMISRIQDQTMLLTMKEKEEAWKEMAKQVAHEVKNPLTPMLLTIQRFEQKFDPQDPNIKEKLRKMTNSVTDQINLVAKVASAFSQFSQLPEKHNELLNLNKEISQILAFFNDDKISLNANKENITINMDKIYLSRIMTNLITNAQQAKRDEVDLEIKIDIEHFQKRIKIKVQDNGTGISDDKLVKIFQPNFTSKSSGMGLGLTMVKKMVEDYHGEISVKTEVGKGTTFTITLPTND